MDIEDLKNNAYVVRKKYLGGEITYKEAKEQLKEYIQHANIKSAEIARKYNQYPKKIKTNEFLRFKF